MRARSIHSWNFLRFVCAERRKLLGETPAARWNVRTKFDTSPKPTSKATSAMERRSSANSRAARRSRSGPHIDAASRQERRQRAAENETNSARLGERRFRDRSAHATARRSTAPLPPRGGDLVPSLPRFSLSPSGDLDETRRKQHSRLLEADVAPVVGGCLRKLTEYHELGQRRYAPPLLQLANRPLIDSTSSGASSNERHSSP